MFDVDDLSAGYGAVRAVRGVSLRLEAGQVLAILGPNGAGKSTLANAVSGLHTARTGRITLAGQNLDRARATVLVRAGVALVPQGRRIFASCTVAEHVGLARAGRRPTVVALDEVLELFPRLRERWSVRARQLSGGEQQMLAITRAVLLAPRVLVLDEPTEGLAPSIVAAVGRLLALLRAKGVGVLLMERPGPFAHAIADQVATMERGRLSHVSAAPGSVDPTHDRPEGDAS